MDESDRLILPGPFNERVRPEKRATGFKQLVGALVATTTMLMLVAWTWPLFSDNIRSNSTGEFGQMAVKGDKVLVELFVMSRCPDAVKVEDVFARVVPEVQSILDVQLNFIAKLDPNATYGAECKHGDAECRGNIDEICGLRYGPDLTTSWWFLQCLNGQFDHIGKDPDLSLKCASSAGLDTAAFLACAEQAEGRELFRQSVENTLFAGVERSATVYIDGKPRCVRDGEWRDCPGGYAPGDFIRDICAAYKGSLPPPTICDQYQK